MTVRRPVARPLDPTWVEHDGKPLLVLRDRVGLIPEPVGVPPAIGLILSLCDGSRTEPEILSALTTHIAEPLQAADLATILDQLESALILEGSSTEAARLEAVEAFRGLPARPAALAGAIYPAEPTTLRETLAGYGKDDRETSSKWDSEIRGVVSPHIDYARGGSIYHRVWKRAAPALQAADVIVIFGTDHSGGPGRVTVTRQSYETPFGRLETDQSVVTAIVEAIGDEAAFGEELHHRGEHSIELAAVWAAYLRDGPRPTVVPVLCGSFHRYTSSEVGPESEAVFTAVVDAIRTATVGRRIVAVAAADLAHVGPAFGDGAPLDLGARQQLKDADERILHTVAAGRPDTFVEQIRAEGDRRRICGLPPIYLTLRLLDDARGEVVGYQQCPADDTGGSLVSIAGMVLW